MQPTGPSGPNPSYDFILKDPVKTKASFGLPALKTSALNSRLGIIGLVIVVLVLFSILLFGHSTSNSQGLVSAVARGQEIARISSLVTQETNNADTKNLATTVQTSMLSQQQQLIGYLKTRHIKLNAKSEAIYKNTSTDAQLTAAAQAGNLDSVYKDYLKTSLNSYQAAISTAYPPAGTTARGILGSAYQSNQVIISSL